MGAGKSRKTSDETPWSSSGREGKQNGVSAQISLYPLGQENLDPAIRAVWATLQRHGLDYQVGAMSTLTWGEDGDVFAALREAFKEATRSGPAVMVVTVSNACPLPKGDTDE